MPVVKDVNAKPGANRPQVRAVALPDPSIAFTASRDGTSRIWKQTATSSPTYDATEASHGATFKTSLAYAPEAKGYPEGLLYVGGQDGIIEARQPGTTSERDADGLMTGHANQVCSLDVNVEAGYIVSGSWDHTAKVWQIGKWEPDLELQGHNGSVWAVVAYDRETIVTGCADRGIRVFDLRGKVQGSFDAQDVVRAVVKLPTGHSTGGEIASATNDGVIRIWSLRGKMLQTLTGHEAFIYSLAVLPTGEIVSSGEDRTVRIWDGPACRQVITLPAISVWAVAASPDGDIITGSSDKTARIFTRDQDRVADPALLAQFDEQVQSSAIPQQQMGEINKTDMPGPEFLRRKSGTKEGQIQQIKEQNGSISAYSWSSATGWQMIGTVVESAGASSTKTSHQGKEYDYVFDIDIRDGAPPLKLPFNVTQNPHEVAMKFLQDNELPLTYLEETANFIVKNTQGTSLGTPAPASAAPGADPWGSEIRYRPDAQSTYKPPPAAASSIKLPYKDYISIAAGKPDASHRQIQKLNAQYVASGDSQQTLSDSELAILGEVFKKLGTHKFDGKASLTATSDMQQCLPIAVKVATEWQPPQNRLAGLDMLRFLAAAAKEFPDYEVDGQDIASFVGRSGIFSGDILAINTKLAMVAIRFYTNLSYGSEHGRKLIEGQYDFLVDCIKAASTTAANDAALAVAITTFYLNLAVYITSGALRKRNDAADRGLTIVEEVSKILDSLPAVDSKLTGAPLQQATEPAFRAIVAIGTVLIGLKDEQITMAAKEIFGLPSTLDKCKDRGLLREPRFQGFVSEIKGAMK